MRNREIAFVLKLQNQTTGAVRGLTQQLRGLTALLESQAQRMAQSQAQEARALLQNASIRARLRREQAAARDAENRQSMAAIEREGRAEQARDNRRARKRIENARAREAESRASIAATMLEQRAEQQADLGRARTRKERAAARKAEGLTNIAIARAEADAEAAGLRNNARTRQERANARKAEASAQAAADRTAQQAQLAALKQVEQTVRNNTAEIRRQAQASAAANRVVIEGLTQTRAQLATQREGVRLTEAQQRANLRTASDQQRLNSATSQAQAANSRAATATANTNTANLRTQRAGIQVQQQGVGLARQQNALQAQTAINAARTTSAQRRAQTAANATARSNLALQMQQMRQQALQQRLAQQGAGGGGFGGGGGGGGSAIIAGGRNALAAIGGAAAIASAIRMADEYRNLEARVSLVTNSQTQQVAVMESLTRAALDTRVSLRATADVYYSLARNNATLALTQRELVDVTRAINQTIAISGTSAVSAGYGLMQLGQAFGTGVLRGEELNSVLEQMPRLAQAIAENLPSELGVVTAGGLKTLAEQGRLTVQLVIDALRKAIPQLQAEFARMPLTVSQGFTVARTGLQVFIAEFDKAAGATNGLGRLLANIGETLASPDFIQGAADFGNKMAEIGSTVGGSVATAFRFLRDNIEEVTTAAKVLAVVFAGVVASRVVLAINAMRLAMIAFNATMAANPLLRIVTGVAALFAAAGTAYALFRQTSVSAEQAAENNLRAERALQATRGLSLQQLREMTDVQRAQARVQQRDALRAARETIRSLDAQVARDQRVGSRERSDVGERRARVGEMLQAAGLESVEAFEALRQKMREAGGSVDMLEEQLGQELPVALRNALRGVSPLIGAINALRAAEARMQEVTTDPDAELRAARLREAIQLVEELTGEQVRLTHATREANDASMNRRRPRVVANLGGESLTRFQNFFDSLVPDAARIRELEKLTRTFEELMVLQYDQQPQFQLPDEIKRLVEQYGGLERAYELMRTGYSSLATAEDQATVRLRDQTLAVEALNAAYTNMFAVRNRQSGSSRGAVVPELAQIQQQLMEFRQQFANERKLFVTDNAGNIARDSTGQPMLDVNNQAVQQAALLREQLLLRNAITQAMGRSNQAAAEATQQEEILRETAGLSSLSAKARNEYLQQAIPLLAMVAALQKVDAEAAEQMSVQVNATLKNLREELARRGSAEAGNGLANMFADARAELAAFQELSTKPLDMRANFRRIMDLRREVAGAMGSRMDDPGVIAAANELATVRFARERLDLASQIQEQQAQSRRAASDELAIANLSGVEYEANKTLLEQVNQLRNSGLGFTDEDIKRYRDILLPLLLQEQRVRERTNILRQATDRSDSMVRDLSIQAETIGLVGDQLEVARFRAEALYDLRRANGGIVTPEDVARVNELARGIEVAQARLAENRTFANGLREGINEFIVNAQDTFQIARQGVSQMAQHMEDAIMNFATTGKFAFKDFAKSVIQDIMRIIARQMILNAVMGVMGLFGGGGSAAAAPGGAAASSAALAGGSGTFGDFTVETLGPLPRAHKGGIAGGLIGMSRMASAAVFAGAQRYHTGGLPGLGKNEVPIIAKKGEAILPTVRLPNGQMGVQAVGGGGGGGVFAPQINITVNGGGGNGGNDAEGQAAFARSIAKEMDRALEMKMREFTSTQMRPGGMFNSGMR
jgi:tape measure domain-containing protein